MLFCIGKASSSFKLALTQSIFLIAAVVCSQYSLHAQEGEEIFRGTWQAESPEKGALILIAKRAGLASYFWGDNADNTVYKGTWTPNGDNADFRWEDGTSFTLQREALGFSLRSKSNLDQELFASRAQQVPQEVLGQWAKPPSEPEDLTSDRDEAKGFFGIWEIQSDDSKHYMVIESDRSAASTWSDSRTNDSGSRGAWAKQGGELHIAWESGHYSILRENERGFSYKRIEPGQIIEDDETEFAPAVRTIKENLPRSWVTEYDASREKLAGVIAFSSRKAARQFYRGDWLVQIQKDGFEKVTLGRFGGLATSLDRTLSGQWLMSGQDIFMRWDDGMRKILSPIGRGFVVYEYRPGRPLDGVPSRVFAASPADSNKLLAYAKGREEVAAQMIDLAEAAGIDPASAESGWGSTFMRWAWPFSDTEDQTSSSAILTETYVEDPASEDPWWWPFWSEKPVNEPTDSAADTEATESDSSETEEAQAAVASLEEPVSEEATAAESTAQAQPKPLQNPKKNDWYWPF